MAELFDSLASQTRFTHHFWQYLIAFCNRPEAASDVISGRFVEPLQKSGVVIDPTSAPVRVKFGDSMLNIGRIITLHYIITNF